MSSWVNVEGYIETSNPSVILDQVKIEERWIGTHKYTNVDSPWFCGSEGNAIIKKTDNGLSIDGDLRDRDKEDFGHYIDEFIDIIKQCQGTGYLRMTCAGDIKQIEMYESKQITECHSAFSRWYNKVLKK